VIREAIQGLCLTSCANKYCAVMHARGLIAEGFSLAEVKRLVESQELPAKVPERGQWEVTLRRVRIIFREPQLAPKLYKTLLAHHSAQEVADIGAVIAFSLLHKFLLEMYSDEILIAEEPILFKTVDCGPELIQYFSHSEREQVPWVTLCCMCKDVKNKDQ
jgi:hypothetical protein